MDTVKSTLDALLKQVLQPSTDYWTMPVCVREDSFNSQMMPSTLNSTSLVTRSTQMPWHKAWGPISFLTARDTGKIPMFPQQAFPQCVLNHCFSHYRSNHSGCPHHCWARSRALSHRWRHRHKRRTLTAIVFSLIPPTGRIFPVNDTSPVIATFCLTGQFMASDSKAVTIVHPALGPSFGVAPCLKKKKHKLPTFSSFKE